MFDFRFLILFGKFQNQPDRRSAEKKSQFIVIEFDENAMAANINVMQKPF